MQEYFSLEDARKYLGIDVQLFDKYLSYGLPIIDLYDCPPCIKKKRY